MTSEERLARISPRHSHFALIADPWHFRALVQIPAVALAYREQRVHQGIGDDAQIHGGEQTVVWYSFDARGNPIQEWGFDAPPVQ